MYKKICMCTHNTYINAFSMQYLLYTTQTQMFAHIAQSDTENVWICVAPSGCVPKVSTTHAPARLCQKKNQFYTMSSLGFNPCSKDVCCHISTLINNPSLSFLLYFYLIFIFCLIFTMYVMQCTILLRFCIVLDVVCAMFSWDIFRLLTCITITNPTTIPTVLPHYPCSCSSAKFCDSTTEYRGTGRRECDPGVQCHRSTTAQSLLDKRWSKPPTQWCSHQHHSLWWTIYSECSPGRWRTVYLLCIQ